MIILKQHWDFTSQASGLVSIEFLVNNIARCQIDVMSAPGRRRDEDSQERFYRNKILGNLENILSLYRPGYVYSELIEVFWFVCRTVGLLDAYGVTEKATGFSYERERELCEAIDALILMLPEVVMSEACQRCGSDRRYEAEERSQGIESYVQAALDVYARSLVVRLDLAYRKDAQPYATVDVLYESIDRFKEMKRRGHPLFEHLTATSKNPPFQSTDATQRVARPSETFIFLKTPC